MAWFSRIFFLGVYLLLAGAVLGQTASTLRVDEDKVRFRLTAHPVLELPVFNSSDKVLSGDFRLELLDSSDHVDSLVSGKFEEKPGSNIEKVAWPLEDLIKMSTSGLGWRRLHYSFVPRPELEVAATSGFIQLNRVLVGAFELRMTAASQAKLGSKLAVRVRVDEPNSGKPLRGTPVELRLKLEDEDEATQHVVTTDYQGYAVYNFELPKESDADSGEVAATAKRGPYSEDERITFRLNDKGTLTLTTDKPLYQPGQVAHLRVLARGPGRHAAAGAELVITIEDEDENEQYHEKIKTSRFGVASADWEIPDKLRLGEYRVVVAPPEAKDDYGAPRAEAKIRVSRYELPTFTVTADPDRKYYLPGDDAKIRISADYLFGKSVQHATVRVVKQNNRHWDSKQQKWIAEESDAVEGEFDKDGKFEAKLDLDDDFKASFNPKEYSHYEDLTLAAYVTDLSTKRTEQRRFRIRLSEAPIQIYVITGNSWSSGKEDPTLFVTTSYADGTPAAVSGTLYFAEPNNEGQFEEDPWQGGTSKALTFRTNRFGVGKITLPRIRDRFLVKPRERYRYYSSFSQEHSKDALLLFEVRDNKGNVGRGSQGWTVALDRTYLRVRTANVLHHPGEALAVTIESNSPDRDVIVSVSTAAGMISSQATRLTHGRAELTFEYDSRMKGEVEIGAFTLAESSNEAGYALSSAAHVIYPALQDLKVNVKMARTTYRPGETASADFSVRSPQGKPVESDLGILVFDRAVAERVRSDEDFGRPYGFSIFDYERENNLGQIAGIGYRDLLGLDPAQAFNPDLQLLAEALMASAEYNWWGGNVTLAGGENYIRDSKNVFFGLMHRSLKPVLEALQSTYESEHGYPRNDSQLQEILSAKTVDLAKIEDPWGLPYKPQYSVSGTQDVLTFVSNGPDKTAGTADDVQDSLQWPYFLRTGQTIEQMLREYPQNSGKYVRDYATLRELMKAKRLDPDTMLDPWGHRYRYTFAISGAYFQLTVSSAGPDGVFDAAKAPSYDDVQEWSSSIHYFMSESHDLEEALAEHFAKTKQFPQTEDELKPVLESAKLAGKRLIDPWGRSYHFTFSKRSRYSDRINVSTYYDYVAKKERRNTEVTPVTQDLGYISVVSYGPDNKPEEAFAVAEFSRVIAEQSSKELEKKETTTTSGVHSSGIQGPMPSGSGAITGAVTDTTGAVVPGATVTCVAEAGTKTTTKSDANGRYLISGLSPGNYELQVLVTGFQPFYVTRIPIQPGITITVDAMMQVGGASQTVEVSAEAVALNTQSASLQATSAGKALGGTAAVEKPLFTPRLRKYFPETLLWKPEVITDAGGRAHIDFPMADNITAWSMSVMASTEAGQVGVAQKELQTFQPFFVEHDPPKILTEGDQISLPVVLRNYSQKPQTLSTELKPEPWFAMLSPAQQNVTVAAGGDANAVFSFRATTMVKAGTQRVTARNADTGDAVEREVRVHPDGQEISFTSGRILGGADQALEVQIPQTAIPGSMDAELRIYPNLIAHVLDAMKGIARKPAGCAEQITSIAYVSLEALQLLEKAGVDGGDPSDPRTKLYAEARKSVQDAYALLPSLQKESGGFSYWNKSSEDVALTAYVLRFLAGAREYVEVDEQVLARARGYLISQQGKSGAWTRYDWSTKGQKDDPMKTAYVARALATSSDALDARARAGVDQAVAKALAYLDDRISEWADPYLVGNYALAAVSAKREDHMANARELLRRLAHEEGSTTYWNLEANSTPFYGWGTAGRLETTALAVEALAKIEATRHDASVNEQVNRGLQYLLTHKDRYACWYSTQATQNVIEALIAAMPEGKEAAGGTTASVVVNGAKLKDVDLPRTTELTGPKILDFGKELKAGNNTIAIERGGSSGAMHTNVITSYYIPWASSEATESENFKSGETRALKLKVTFDRHEAKISDRITCNVEAERIGFAGYGMMIAEIGLPPGAEVDRDSLERAKETGVDGYEVQPDRVVFYLWPSAGGSKFQFSFRPRFAMKANSAPSILYDYYNPDANAVVVPVQFRIQ